MKNSTIRRSLSFLALASLFVSVAVAGPVSYYGKIKTVGKNIKDAAGTNSVLLKGPSLYWSSDEGANYYNQKTVDWFVDNMDISVIRAAMAIKYYGNNENPIGADGNSGYLSTNLTDAKALHKARIDAVIQAAILNDIYVIVDWHSHNASSEQSEAVAFFSAMATQYKDCPNIIWEVYNEPVDQSAATIYNYANAVIAAIRAAGSTNLVLVGSTSWSQKPGEMASQSNPLHTKYANVAYTFHFYSATHNFGGTISSSANSAMNSGAAVFGSEWGSTTADGLGAPNEYSATGWLDWMDQNKISSCMWSVSDFQGSSIFKTGTAMNLSTSALSPAGTIFQNYMARANPPPTGFPTGKSKTYTLADGASKTISLTDVSASSGATFTAPAMSAALGTLTVTGTSITYDQPATGVPAVVSFNFVLNNAGKTSMHRITLNINRKPSIKDTTIDVSYASTGLVVGLSALGIADPDGDVVTFSSITGGMGTITKATSGLSFTYKPSAGFLGTNEFRTDAFQFTITDGTYSLTKTVTFRVRNMPPTLYAVKTWTIGNDTLFHITPTLAQATDPEAQGVRFINPVIVETGYAGTLTLSADSKVLEFMPAPGQYGTIHITYQANDYTYDSKVATATLIIKGNGVPITATPIQVSSQASSFQVFSANQFSLGFRLSKAGSTQVDLFSVSGTRLRSFDLGEMASGDHRFAWDLANVPQGIYVARVSQGAVAKVIQFVK
jgi:hypothetical protein